MLNRNMIGELHGGIRGLRSYSFIGKRRGRSVGKVMGKGKFDGNNFIFFGNLEIILFFFGNNKYICLEKLLFNIIKKVVASQTYFNLATQV